MNKNVRKMLAMMLAFIMVFAAAVPVFAEDDGNIPVSYTHLVVIYLCAEMFID